MKYILITGITGAVGSAAAEYFHNLGYGILGVGRKKKTDIEKDVSRYCTDYFALPAFNDEYCQKLFEEIVEKKYSVKAAVFFNGGFNMDKLQNFSQPNFDKLLDQNFLSTVFISKYCLSLFQQQNEGCFIFTSAASTDLPESFSNTFSYTASKSLINHLALSIQADRSIKNIRVALLKPGTIKTQANIKAMPDADQSQWTTPSALCERVEKFIEDGEKRFEEIYF